MDDKTQALYDTRARQIDVELQQDLIKIDEEYSKRGIPGSGLHHRARGLAEVKANARKDEIRAELIRKEEILSDKVSLHLGNPPFGMKNGICLGNKCIPIPHNTDMESLCKVIFSERIGTIWSWDEVMIHDGWGESEDQVYANRKKWWRKIYNAARDINEKVGKLTQIYNLLLIPTIKEVQINPQYIK